MRKQVLKISALVRYLKGLIDNHQQLQQVAVSGEISNLTKHRSGHWYFTIKDEDASLRCVMFSSAVSRCKVDVKNGDQVILQGSVSIFESSGQLQLYVTQLQLDGIGDLYYQFEQLKKKLFEKGYFDESHKKELPLYPQKIGLITGKNTAAREDVLSTLNRRWPLAEVVEINTLVQGENAASQMIAALNTLDKKELDVILLVRGGGSIEDLWAFNNEDLALTIFNMITPIVTGVGHEVDTTIVDYVSDKRAPTPTGAAEIATPNQQEIKNRIKLYQQSLLQCTYKKLNDLKKEVRVYKESSYLRNPAKLYQQKILLVDMKRQQLFRQSKKISDFRLETSRKLHYFYSLLSTSIQDTKQEISLSKHQLNQQIHRRQLQEKNSLGKAIDLLDAYSPLKILKRGYSLAYNNEQLISSVEQVEVNDTLKLKLSDGELITKIVEKRSS